MSVANEPVKRVFGEADIPNWIESEAFYKMTSFIAQLGNSIQGTSLRHPDVTTDVHPAVISVGSILKKLQEWAEETPLRHDPQRFGNLAFRDWGKRVESVGVSYLQGCALLTKAKKNARALHQDLIPDTSDVLPELLHHFCTSFGSFTRIDYGSGHELSFFAYLSLYFSAHLQLSTKVVYRNIISHIYVTYLDLCLVLQKRFRLEPAGSKGVWGLDDFKFLSYLFGASQLSTIPPGPGVPRVSDIAKPIDMQSTLAQENLLFKSVAQIHVLKRGPFFEHSPVLYNIATTVPNWSKVYSGLQKMYVKEVLEKWPVVQHFYFGKHLSWTSHVTGQPLPVNPLAHANSATQDDEEASMLTRAPWASVDVSGTGPTVSGTAPAAQPGQSVHVPWLRKDWKPPTLR